MVWCVFTVEVAVCVVWVSAAAAEYGMSYIAYYHHSAVYLRYLVSVGFGEEIVRAMEMHTVLPLH